MIQLARLIDPGSRRIRQVFEQQVDEPQRQAYGKIANARFAVYGSSVYPDATFTLRLAFGEAKGYTEGGEKIPWATTLGGTYEHAAAHNNKEPFELPKIWNDRKSQLNLSTRVQFRQHGRHHRRQFRQPGDQSPGRTRRNHIRRQHRVSGAGLHLYGSDGARRGGPFRGNFGSAAEDLSGQSAGGGNHRKEIVSDFSEPIFTEYKTARRVLKYGPPQQYLSCDSV